MSRLRTPELESDSSNAVSGPESIEEAKARLFDNFRHAKNNILEDMGNLKRKFSPKNLLPGAKKKARAKNEHVVESFVRGGRDCLRAK
ncbi:hypothetical protein NW762_002836 [Fusarium torreyae]|uniref:Uncharacterized protein n=1 Tax=Fusarium torreyae TaxID=1237075 RepID=A0A9W8SBZ5_9HYPO|nr:hypothetical protein NW762_002836 [Fusarium torreyae]